MGKERGRKKKKRTVRGMGDDLMMILKGNITFTEKREVKERGKASKNRAQGVI